MGSNNRPSYDKNDAYIGCDSNYCQEAHTGIAIGAPVSISGYIANAGDGAAWKERLTATQKSFAVPIKTPGATLKLSTNEIAAHTCSVAQTVALAGLSPDSVLSGVLRELQLASLGMARGLCKFLLSPQPIQPILWCATSPLLASRRELLL